MVVQFGKKIFHVMEFSPYEYPNVLFEDAYIIGLKERRMQFEHDGRTIMIRVVQRQHGGSFLRLTWNLGITLFGSSTTEKDERANFYFQEFTPMVHWIGFLKEQFSEGLTKFLQYLIALLIGS